ncbi:MAG TPA: hypothetical protein VE344_09720 [Methylomirabilota bacterium]|nr:hypothetical protein [Methylomirabilota bacterium]
MGFLKKIFGSRADVQELPMGSVTVNAQGNVVTSTVSSAYSKTLLSDIAREVLVIFREAKEAQLPLAEVTIHFASLRVSARELRGGAIIFLMPQTSLMPSLK